MLQRPFAIVTLFGLLWLSSAQPMDPEPPVQSTESEQSVQCLPPLFAEDAPNYWPCSPSAFTQKGDASDNDDDGEDMGNRDRVMDEADPLSSLSLGSTIPQQQSMGLLPQDVKKIAAKAFTHEKDRLGQSFSSYVRYIDNRINAFNKQDSTKIDALDYLGPSLKHARVEWQGEPTISLLFIYWDTEIKKFKVHPASLTYDEIFTIDYQALCFNGMRPALVKVFDTTIANVADLKAMADTLAAGILARLGNDSKQVLIRIGDIVKANQENDLAKSCKDSVTRYAVPNDMMRSASSQGMKQMRAFRYETKAATKSKKRPLSNADPALQGLKKNGPLHTRLSREMNEYRGYVDAKVKILQNTPAGTPNLTQYVLAVTSRLSTKIHMGSRSWVWDKELHNTSPLATLLAAVAKESRPLKLHSDKDRAAFVDRFDTFLLDCDGVLWHDKFVIDGVTETLARLRHKGKRILFVTNNSTKSRDAYLKKFQSLGIAASKQTSAGLVKLTKQFMNACTLSGLFIDVRQEEIFGSSYATATYLAKVNKLPADKKVYVIGESGIKEELTSQGIPVLEAADDYDGLPEGENWSDIGPLEEVGAVVIGFDRKINYRKFAKAHTYITHQKDCRFIATNADLTIPMFHRVLPGTGSFVSVLTSSTGQQPVVIGKPHRTMLDCIIEKYHLDRERTCMVGDRLDTDIQFGINGNVATLLVLTGVTTECEAFRADQPIVPDYVMDSFGHLATIDA
ncbi:hypothetical protein H4R35_005112 [Dimargaris xerosporica]|nr:hypothetical protein H4R35_005112 [Dimargaris xerosporica]